MYAVDRRVVVESLIQFFTVDKVLVDGLFDTVLDNGGISRERGM